MVVGDEVEKSDSPKRPASVGSGFVVGGFASLAEDVEMCLSGRRVSADLNIKSCRGEEGKNQIRLIENRIGGKERIRTEFERMMQAQVIMTKLNWRHLNN